MACVNKTAWGAKTDSNSRPGLPCELCQSRSPTDGTALPFALNVFFSLPAMKLYNLFDEINQAKDEI